MRKANIFILALVVISFAIGIWLYPQMPDSMASHWNAAGQVDGYMPKFWGLFLMPIISLAILLLFVAIPRIDPLKENIAKFRKHFDIFIVLIMLFLLYIYLLTLFWGFGARFNIMQAMSPALAILFYYAGVMIGHSKRNWFIGIRTPWTLSSDRVWEKTHKRGSKLFKAAGIICLLGAAFPDYAIWLIIAPVLVVAVYSIVYSYFLFRDEEWKK